MPSAPRSLQVTDAYRGQLVALRGRVLAGVAAGWGQVSLDDLDGTAAAWATAADELLAAGRRQAAALSDVYLASYVTSETGRRVTPVVRDREQGGLSVASAVIAVKVALGYQRPPAQALRAGLVRAQRITAGETAKAARDALSEGMAESDQIAGWRRATSGDPCGACMAAATGAIRADDEVPEAHAYCQCVAEPVVKGLEERAPRPTGEELFDRMTVEQQDQLFAGRGGAEKAALVRDGAVQISDLIDRSPMAAVPDVITETPLAALKP